MSLGLKFKILHLCTHLLSLIGIVWVFHSHQYYWLLVAFAFYLYAGIVGVNVALHRYFAHQSFQTSRFGYWILLISSFLPMLGSPAAWGSIHRFHHTHSDSDLDPHSPKHLGAWKSWMTAWPSIDMPLSTFRSFIRDKRISFLDRHYFQFALAYAAILAVIDWRLACFVFALPAIGCFHGAAAIAVIPHVNFPLGYANHKTEDRSQNNVFAWILSLGEGWHNNHHHDPSKYRHGEKWWEIDPPAFVIKFFFMKPRTDENRAGEKI